MTGLVASAADTFGPSKGEDNWAAPGLSVIIGVADVTESRWVGYLRFRHLKKKKRRTQVTKRTKKPKTEITAIAQWGKEEMAVLFWTLPVGLDVEDKLEFDKPVGKDDEDESMVESIESGYVVSVTLDFRQFRETGRLRGIGVGASGEGTYGPR